MKIFAIQEALFLTIQIKKIDFFLIKYCLYNFGLLRPTPSTVALCEQ